MADKIKIRKTEAEWAEQLTPQQFNVLRRQATERPYTGEYVSHKSDGTYCCAACGQQLFASSSKFDSHCGWPSFWDMVEEGTVEWRPDNSHGMRRTEVICRQLRFAFGPRVQRRPARPDRIALLHQFGRAEFRAKDERVAVRSGVRASCPGRRYRLRRRRRRCSRRPPV